MPSSIQESILNAMDDEDFRLAFTHKLMDDDRCRELIGVNVAPDVNRMTEITISARRWRKMISIGLMCVGLFAHDIFQWIINRMSK